MNQFFFICVGFYDFQLESLVQHIAEVDPAPAHQLHRDPQVAQGNPGMSQQVPQPTQRHGQRGQQQQSLQTGSHKVGGRADSDN